MTVRELYYLLNEKIPSSLSCPWDNDGIMCCPDRERSVRRVLITLDVTRPAVRHAVEGGYDLIVSHHPLIFKGLKAVHEENPIGSKAIQLIQNSISVMSFHTRLDALEGGVNDILAERLGLREVVPFGTEDEAIGRIGRLAEPMHAEDFAMLVKERLNAPSVVLSDAGLPVRRVAVLGGGGEDDVSAARAAGADTYVTGELKYHSLVDAPEEGMNLIEAGHFYTEFPVCRQIEAMLLSIDPTLTCEIYDSCALRVL